MQVKFAFATFALLVVRVVASPAPVPQDEPSVIRCFTAADCPPGDNCCGPRQPAVGGLGFCRAPNLLCIR
ncbi:hypothetical protein NLJ89_g4310 [Agrocybe chaxingu]|uniref:Uncharacterized protein n=1 Tax=Agrocybe chaxingu TaxID=84603 RepID=A0A9W8K8W8_9AGAR|nr:hypothetical protein NLJ89_g4310 [Agrocybe chaxingu]